MELLLGFAFACVLLLGLLLGLQGKPLAKYDENGICRCGYCDGHGDRY